MLLSFMQVDPALRLRFRGLHKPILGITCQMHEL